MRRRLLFFSLTVVLVACSGGSAKRSNPSTTTTRGTSTTTAGNVTTTAGQLAPDLAAAHVKLTKVATANEPVALVERPNSETSYVVQQSGEIRPFVNGRLGEAVLDISADVTDSGEQGLLGLAFSPDGSKLYVDYTDTNGDTRIVEYSIGNGKADPKSRRELLKIDQPQANHNGGQLVVDGHGLLYIGMGDGGAAGDQGEGHASGGNGQSLATLLGKILRIDPTPSGDKPYTIPSDNPFVHTKGARPEIWSYGLRNPWRFSFDRETRDLWIGDVGQSGWEEVDFRPAGQQGGENFGWNRLEGTHSYRGTAPENATAPVYEYSHRAGGCSIVGGFVYRGAAIPALRGAYVFGDYCDGNVRGLTLVNGRPATHDLASDVSQLSSFGEDNAGELYVLSLDGAVSRIDPA